LVLPDWKSSGFKVRNEVTARILKSSFIANCFWCIDQIHSCRWSVSANTCSRRVES
jgi:hypothetical protein